MSFLQVNQTKLLKPWIDLKKQLTQDLKDLPTDLFTANSFPNELMSRLSTLNFPDTDFHYPQAKAALWLTQIDQLLYLVELTEQIQEPSEEDWKKGEEPTEEELFDYWNESSYANSFSELMKEGETPLTATFELLPLLEQQILSFFDLHLDDSPSVEKTETPFLYQPHEELGENEGQLILGPKGDIFSAEEKFPDYPNIYIYFYSPEDRILCYEKEKHQATLESDSSAIKVSVEKQKFISLFSSLSSQDSFNVHEWSHKVQSALSIIQEASPRCFSAFQTFTNTLIAMEHIGVVSFSFKDLPGVSHINIKERDFVDTIDDLVHENGHHVLNHKLREDELIYEDDEKIFYSPWRETYRPVRGLYHAYCTFCWAHFLFTDLSQKILDGNSYDLDKEQINKIFKRTLEENIMLKASEKEIEKAYKLRKITDHGHTLFNEFKAEVEKDHALVQQIKIKLSKDNPTVIEKLQNFERNLARQIDE